MFLGIRSDEPATSRSMQRLVMSALALSVLGADPALAGPQSFPVDGSTPRAGWQTAELRQNPQRERNLGDGFLEFLFGGGRGVRAAASLPSAPNGHGAHPTRASTGRSSNIPATRSPAPSSSIPASVCSTWSRTAARRSATASGSAAQDSPGPASRKSR